MFISSSEKGLVAVTTSDRFETLQIRCNPLRYDKTYLEKSSTFDNIKGTINFEYVKVRRRITYCRTVSIEESPRKLLQNYSGKLLRAIQFSSDVTKLSGVDTEEYVFCQVVDNFLVFVVHPTVYLRNWWYVWNVSKFSQIHPISLINVAGYFSSLLFVAFLEVRLMFFFGVTFIIKENTPKVTALRYHVKELQMQLNLFISQCQDYRKNRFEKSKNFFRRGWDCEEVYRNYGLDFRESMILTFYASKAEDRSEVWKRHIGSLTMPCDTQTSSI
ncbi:hypothetical protein HZH68_000981 [Vespula germanica]|uniref:Uncharacterized protein n=1 Tax=Vespula germanica TaxID=30212 RepID=A0A834NUJ9_VESGE|nr:hypothetical protein HZH68_000981 [Vespula germanica]